MANQKVNTIRQDILFRARLISIAVFIIMIIAAVKLWYIQQTNGDRWRSKAHTSIIRNLTIPAIRGNIYAADGSLLATSVPYYTVGLDLKYIRQKPHFIFTDDRYLSTLCQKFSTLFNDRTAKEYQAIISAALADSSDKYLQLSRKKISFQDKRSFMSWVSGLDTTKAKSDNKTTKPKQPASTGIVFDATLERFKPFGGMAQRTIGGIKANDPGVGLEGFFNKQLSGVEGKGLYERLAGGSWRPVDDEAETRPEPGMDLHTTLDVNIQDVAESSLRQHLKQYNAKYGCVIVMEVATGQIKAIANLQKVTDSVYAEGFNYAIVGKCDPGSIFKVPTMVALLEEAKISPNDSVRTGTGALVYRGKKFEDDHPHGTMSVKQVMAYSSNVGIFKLMQQHFFSKPDRYANYYLKERFHLGDRVGIHLRDRDPEPKPILKDPATYKKRWNPLTLPQMAIGYEVDVTPLQMLTFYNAVANNGYWVQPILVKQVRLADEVIEDFTLNQTRPEDPICSPETLEKVKEMMEGVVQSGTARKIYTPNYRIAGKTGTAKVLENGRYQNGRYHTSFAGFFPANQPKYSCIVVVHEPRGTGGGQLMAADAAAPVFRDIADKIYASDVQMHRLLKKAPNQEGTGQNYLKASHSHDAKLIAEELSIKSSKGWQDQNVEKYKVPNLQGMSLRDALYILENKGFRVAHRGTGRVVEQSLPAGTKAGRNQLISLVLH